MKNEVVQMLAKAEDCLESAIFNLHGGFYDAAANRAYYGKFDALTALLTHFGLVAKSHNGARTLFSEHFIKTEKMPRQSGLWLTYCFEMRQQSDYDFNSKIEFTEAETCVDYCRKFIDSVKNLLSD